MKQTIGLECRLAIPSSFWRIANNTLMEDTSRMTSLLDVTEEEARNIVSNYQKSKSVGGSCLAEVMRATDIGKYRLIESGELSPSEYLCEDSSKMTQELIKEGYNIEIFTKGGAQCVYSALRHTQLNDLIENGQMQVTSVSTDRFENHDRRTPECYREWIKRMKYQDKNLLVYVTDREDEGISSLKSGIPTAMIDRTHQYGDEGFYLENGLWVMKDLSGVKPWLNGQREKR